MSKKTITESELLELVNTHAESCFPRCDHGTESMKFALKAIGITVVPGPLPEPEGDVIVLDADDDIWVRWGDEWYSPAYGITKSWAEILEDGRPKIYRLEEEKHD